MYITDYWKGIIAFLGTGLGLAVEYTNLWNSQILPAIIGIATIIGVVAKGNTKDGEKV